MARWLFMAAALVAAAGFLEGCRQDVPTAGSGSEIVMSANPTTVGLGESSAISIAVFDDSGAPAKEGIEIFLSTDPNLGTVSSSVPLGSDGTAEARFVASSDRTGKASVAARSGKVTATVVITIVASESPTWSLPAGSLRGTRGRSRR